MRATNRNCRKRQKWCTASTLPEPQEEWDNACSYLSKSNIEQLEQLANAVAPIQGCGLRDRAQGLHPAATGLGRARNHHVDAGSLRHEGEQGFLIYYGAGHVKYAMPLRDEGGSWKVAALSGTTLG